VAPLLRPTLDDVSALAPDLEATFDTLRPLVARAREALPAATRVLEAARPLVQELHLVSRTLVPVVEYAYLYRREVVNFFAKGAAASNAVTYNAGTGKPVHAIRLYVPVNAEALTLYPARPGANRFNPYPAPGALNEFAKTLETFDCRHRLNPSIPVLSAAIPCREQEPIEFQGKKQALPQLQPVG
jgi:phospholipid/cholesterol/gamma-HCH transport system substrate-binding protein